MFPGLSEEWETFQKSKSEIRVKGIHVNQGVEMLEK